MKKFFLSFLSLLGLGFSGAAQSHINIELLSATYTTPAVQFRVSWSSIPTIAGQIHNSKIWLWVDFIKIENNQPSGTWTRAVVANPSPGTIAPETNKGFWLQGNTGSYNQIVTVELDIPANTTFNWCAYASDFPPNMVMEGQTYYFKGTPPFILKEADGTIHEITQTSMPKANLTFVPVSITDKTECLGGLKEIIGTCAYTGTDWYADPNHKCQQRTGGAQNWEAWIKDTRDNELYRVIKMPDNHWWLAQNVKYAGAGSEISYCNKDECGRAYFPVDAYTSYDGGSSSSSGNVQGICPANWLLPISTNWLLLVNKIQNDGQSVATSLRALDSSCEPVTNYYGWANIKNAANGGAYRKVSGWYRNDDYVDDARHTGLVVDARSGSGYDNVYCGEFHTHYTHSGLVKNCIRCFRQL
ncbi:MAG: hypothetical protein LBF81_00195 [Prevotellaceae bacterium]|jgi:uncharacterized protein (TIGR02145 family)|nr:hypothetical protein [Prevotellaceae bacterium]